MVPYLGRLERRRRRHAGGGQPREGIGARPCRERLRERGSSGAVGWIGSREADAGQRPERRRLDIGRRRNTDPSVPARVQPAARRGAEVSVSIGVPHLRAGAAEGRIADFSSTLLGPYATLETPTELVPDAPRWAHRVLGARQYTIAGGTSEIQRNIIGERVLGLPRG